MGTRGFVGFKQKGIIKGWYNHFDSYPSGLGEEVVEKFCEYSKETLINFLTKKLTLTKEEDDYSNHKGVMKLDWGKDEKNLKDGSDFIKDGLFCEYSYVFDLDSKRKKLLLFKGFGKKPSKGYEDYYYESSPNCCMGNEKHYTTYKGSISDDNLTKAIVKMYILYNEDESKILKKIKKTTKDELPLLLPDTDGSGIAKKYLELRLKEA